MQARHTTPVPHTPRELKDSEFRRFQTLVYDIAGIRLTSAKRALLIGRLSRRLRALEMDSFGAYFEYVTDPRNEAELVTMIDCLSTNETHFFREPKQFEYMERHIFPAWLADMQSGQRQRHIRVWSAACSTGEEPYSLAMMLLYHFPPSRGWTVEVVATDINTEVLQRARRAFWPIKKAAQIPDRLKRIYMLRGTRSQEGSMAAGAELRSVVRFRRLNLNDKHWPLEGTFDLILVRNVFIYFDQDSRFRTVHRMLRYLAADGHLLLGHAESLNGVTESLRSVAPTIYARTRPGDRPRRRLPPTRLLSSPIFGAEEPS